MKVLVPVKRVIDYNVKVRVKADRSGVDLSNVKMSMNPFDEIAVEAALRLKEAGEADEVIVVSVGTPAAQDVLRTALAMGADRAVLLTTELAPEPLAVAKLVAEVVKAECIDLVITGKQAIDGDMNATGQMLAGVLGWSQATFASRITLEPGQVLVTREIDGGLQTLALKLPAVVTADLRLNEPRYASLPNIMKAKKKPLEEKPAADFGIDLSPRLEVIETREPKARQAGKRVQSTQELVSELKLAGVL